jgi:hypothetical protein
MFLHVESASYLQDYTLIVRFNNGEVVEVDLANKLDGEVFEPLKNTEAFQSFRISKESGTLEWPNGADFAPEFLHEIGKVVVKHVE